MLLQLRKIADFLSYAFVDPKPVKTVTYGQTPNEREQEVLDAISKAIDTPTFNEAMALMDEYEKDYHDDPELVKTIEKFTQAIVIQHAIFKQSLVQ